MNKPYKYIYGSIKGEERKRNQDRVYILENDHASIFMVFDGVSSYDTSYRFIEKYIEIFRMHWSESEINHANLNEILYKAHTEVLDTEVEGMSTLSLFFREYSRKGTGFLINIGDSPVYALSNRCLEKITKDDVVPGYSNVLTRCLGMESLSPDDFIGKMIDIPPAILLCSDGFSNLLEKEKKEYFRVLNFKRPGNIKRRIAQIQSGKNSDDATYILIRNDV